MFEFGRKKGLSEALETIGAMKTDLDSMKKDMANLKLKVESEIAVVRRNFDALVRSIEEGHPEGGQAEDVGNSAITGLTDNEAQNMKQDILYMKRGIMDILEWTCTLEPELKTVHKHIDDARKDIKNKVAYSISRLKT